MNTLDFEKNKVEELTIEQLRNTYKENDIYGNPLKGLYHYEVIEQIENVVKESGLNYSIHQLFAAQNKDKTQPGVVILPQVEEKYGPKAVEAHILRRIFCNINISDFDDDEYSTNIALAFHQNGIQVAYGNLIKICTNQCILGKKQSFYTYGKGAIPFDKIIEELQNWLFNTPQRKIIEEREIINRMKNTPVNGDEMMRIFGMLNVARVLHDTNEKSIRMNDVYPLNQGQISTFIEKIVLRHRINNELNLWDIYNTATELYKPHLMEIPNIMSQNIAMVDFIKTNYLN
jgi:hypothetical protein